MPAKLTHTQEASFLLDIIKHSDLKTINWQAIADKKQIKKGAAQMRYQRLKAAIEKAEAADAGITIPGSPQADGEQILGSPTSTTQAAPSAPVTPKKPRANKVEKPKTPGTQQRKKKAAAVVAGINASMNTSMVSNPSTVPTSPNASMMSPMQSMHSMQSISPAPIPQYTQSASPIAIKMEMREEYSLPAMHSGPPVYQQHPHHAHALPPQQPMYSHMGAMPC